jgi:hypothetical protein
LTIFVSDERIEITNNRGYHEIFKNPYLFNLNGQNVTCNCFDTRCYPGVQPDDDIYFGINRVVGGTFRPGIGLCNAKISWVQCRADVKSIDLMNDMKYVDWFNASQTIEIKNGISRIEIDEAMLSIDHVSIKDRLISETNETTTAILPSRHSILGPHDKGIPLIISQNITVLNITNSTEAVSARLLINSKINTENTGKL